MNYLIGNLVAETFPETARIFYGLSKSEFASEPDLVCLAQQNGLLVAAAALGHVQQLHSYLSNPRLQSKDVHAAFEVAYKTRQHSTVAALLMDPRLHPKKLKGYVGKASPELANTLLASPRIVLKSRDIINAALGSHGGHRDVWGNIHFNDLTTLKMILASPTLHLSSQFCQTMCQVVGDIMAYDSWEDQGVIGEIEPRYFAANHVTYTNFRDLAHILAADSRFAPFRTAMP
jgi:hypothetical protein